MAPAVPVGVIFFMMQPVLWVFIGGGLGSLSRYGLTLIMTRYFPRFPMGTLLANAVACFLLGIFVALHFSGQINESRKLMLVTGFCGGLSTFSTFTFESHQLYSKEGWIMLVTNMVLNLVICFLCLLLGLKFANYGN